MPAIEEVIHEQSDFLVEDVSGNINSYEFVDKGVGLGIGADRYADPAVGSDCFPIGKAFFLVNGPMT